VPSGIMNLIYVACDLMAIGSGAAALFGMLKGSLLEKYAALFLRFALFTSVIGLLFPLPHLLLTQKQEISMLMVYLSGLVIIAWHRLPVAGVWRSTFVLSVTLVLYLCVLAAMSQAFHDVPLLGAAGPVQVKSPIFILHTVFLLLFATLGAVAARRFRTNLQAIGHETSASTRS
jgi:hypothetical protein